MKIIAGFELILSFIASLIIGWIGVIALLLPFNGEIFTYLGGYSDLIMGVFFILVPVIWITVSAPWFRKRFGTALTLIIRWGSILIAATIALFL